MPLPQGIPTRAEVMLRVDGSSRVVSIPRSFLHYLGWLTGARLIVEMAADQKSLHVREMTGADVPPRGRGRIVYDFTEQTTP